MLILREGEKYSSFAFQQESDQFELCLTCKLKMTGFNGVCIKCTVFSPFVYIQMFISIWTYLLSG